MGQALSNIVTTLCGDTSQDEFQSLTRPSHTHIFPQCQGPQLIPTPLSWSRGSDSSTHPVTNSVTNRIVRNPPPGSEPDGYSSSWTREVSQLGLGHLVTRDESDSVRQLGRDPALRWSRGSDSFTHPVTNSVPKRIRSDPYGDSSSQTRKVSQLGHGHLITRDESDSTSHLRRDPAITFPKWLDVSLKDSSITVLEEKKEVVRVVLREEREREEERGGGGGAKVGRVERWMKHYSSFQKILLVGEGDFSFSACLAVTFGCAHNIIATSLDSRGKTNKTRIAKFISEN